MESGVDSLGLSTMKNAVNCDNYCLLQTPKWTIKILNAYCSFDLNQNWSWRRVYMSIQLTSFKIDNALNLSILLSAGKETNRDFICSGERTWNCPRFKICRHSEAYRIVVWCSFISVVCKRIKWLLMNSLWQRVTIPWILLIDYVWNGF